ncbi:hypothetical protein [Caldithrix abyssi]
MIEQLKPGLPRKWLLLFSGIIWSGTGIMLNFLALRWIVEFNLSQIIFVITAGILLGSAIARFGFSMVANKNIKRILAYTGHVCAFAFQEWKSYVLIAVMMTIGLFMRTTELIPKFLLAPLYMGIGFALFLASFLYYQSFFREPAK